MFLRKLNTQQTGFAFHSGESSSKLIPVDLELGHYRSALDVKHSRKPEMRAGSAPAIVSGAAEEENRSPERGLSWLLGSSLTHGDRQRRSVALTFDDGPSDATPALLEFLAAHEVSATFFQCGMNVHRHPTIAREVAAAGHEIGNHTFSHARLCPRFSRKPNILSPTQICTELAQTQQAIAAETGVLPRVFRAPYGLRWIGLGSALRRLHLVGVKWTVIGHDWEWPAERIAEFILGRAAPGSIICLHDGREVRPHPDISEMLAAVRRFVPELKSRNYEFETVSKILHPAARTLLSREGLTAPMNRA